MVNKMDFWAPHGGCGREEEVGIVVLYPRHFANETLEPTAVLNMTQLQEGSLSAVRLRWSCPREIDAEVVAPAVRRKPDARPLGVIVGLVRDIEDITDRAGQQAFSVVADGKRGMPGHAHLGFLGGATKPERRSLRLELLDVFSQIEPTPLMPQCFSVCSWIRSQAATHPVPSLRPIA